VPSSPACGLLPHHRRQIGQISEEFPAKDRSNLLPPIVVGPIHDCARMVKVVGFVPQATIRVFANGSEMGTENAKHEPAKITLSRALVLGDVVTATQSVGAISGARSCDPVKVTAY